MNEALTFHYSQLATAQYLSRYGAYLTPVTLGVLEALCGRREYIFGESNATS